MKGNFFTVFFVLGYTAACGLAAWNPVYGVLLLLFLTFWFLFFPTLVMSIAGIIFSILLGGATLGLAPIILLLLNMVKLGRLMDNLQKRAPFGLGAIVLYLLFVGIAGIDNIPFVVHVERAGSYGLWIFAGILATLGLLTILLTIQIYHAYGYRKGKTALFITGFPWYMASFCVSLINMLGSFDDGSFGSDADLYDSPEHHHHYHH
jgi:hypothetical protein